MPKPPLKGDIETRMAAGRARATRATAAVITPNKPAEQPNAKEKENVVTTPQNSKLPIQQVKKGKGDKGDKSTHTAPLEAISTVLEKLVARYESELSDQVKHDITSIIIYTKKAAEEGNQMTVRLAPEDMKVLRSQIKTDIADACNAIESKLDEHAIGINALSVQTMEIAQTMGEFQDTAKELTGKLGEVSNKTSLIAETATNYRDAVVNGTTHSNRTNTDPKLLSDLERKAKQLLLDFDDPKDNIGQTKSNAELKDKANEVLDALEGTERPDTVKVENITKVRNGALLFQMNSKEAANWLKEPDNQNAFTKQFADGSNFRSRQFNVMAPRIPIIFNPGDRKQLREVEGTNGYRKYTILKARWIKPEARRRPEQTHAFAIFTLTSAEDANRIIRDGINICGHRIRPEKLKQEPIQCMKCRGWGHMANNCQAATDTCGTCGKGHRTNICGSKEMLYCVSCKANTHPSWDRNCPEFVRRRAHFDERYPENALQYFPTDQDWTYTTRPSKIPMDERFPQKFAVNSLPIDNRRQHNPAQQNNKKKQPKNKEKGKQRAEQSTIDKYLNHTQVGCKPTSQHGEEGEITSDDESSLNRENTNRIDLYNDNDASAHSSWE